MKFDMCGAAGVLGAFLSAVELKLSSISSASCPRSRTCRAAMRIVRAISHHDVRPDVEVLNTDAEGRLILCDALTYVQKFDPQVIIDAATLTGACVVALGKHAPGLMTQRRRARRRSARARQSDARPRLAPAALGRIPEQLEPAFADIANIGGKYAGAITAGCFLARFTEGYRWAHLDIAGTAWEERPQGLCDRTAGSVAHAIPDRPQRVT